MYILNWVSSKAVPKTPFELWTDRKLSLEHLHVWGCPVEARSYNLQEKKLDPGTVSYYFIGYPERSKGFRFYCPSHTTRIIETETTRFIEDGENSGSGIPRNTVLQKIREYLPIIVIPKDILLKPAQPEI